MPTCELTAARIFNNYKEISFGNIMGKNSNYDISKSNPPLKQKHIAT